MPQFLWLSRRVFALVHGHNLVYNTCWEDPRLDRVALELSPSDTVMVITSAGCNVLDYSLQGPRHIYAVDMNPRQNALLELKIAGIRHLEFPEFFALFGRGRHPQADSLYRQKLQKHLSPSARAYWDRMIGRFTGARGMKTFYYHGTSGTFARAVNFYIDKVAKIREQVMSLFDAPSVAEQKRIYDQQLRDVFWTGFIRWLLDRDSTLSLLGVPRSQRLQVERDYDGGISQFIEDCVEAVFTQLPLSDNYFWRVYLAGGYTPACCPEYLKPDNFERLKHDGLLDNITLHTGSILNFLRKHDVEISRYILLDHMDWLSAYNLQILQQEWQALLDRAAPRTRFLWRSGGLKVDYVDPLSVQWEGRSRRVGDLLRYNTDLAASLHPNDRVHTYGSFYIADLART